MNDILKLDIAGLKAKLEKKEVSSVEVTKACLQQIEATKDLHAYITVTADEAIAAARAYDGGKTSGALAGIPIAVKDNISTAAIRTTCASKMLSDFVPPYDAHVVEKLKRAGAVIVGKTNMDEFAMGSASANSYFGAVKNPVDVAHVPGGSSGGSAAAVAADTCFASLGSDTGGSIRQPASFCGVVGYKPTYSLVSRYGLVAFASSLDQIGPVTKTVADAGLLFDVIAGHDGRDSTSFAGQYPVMQNLDGSLKGKRIGVAKQFFTDDLHPEIRAAIEAQLRAAERAGATLVDVSIDSFSAALACYYILSSAEAATNLARYDGVKYGFRAKAGDYTDYIDLYVKTRTQGFGDEVKRRIMIGNYVLSSGYYDAYYLKALKVRTLIKRDFDAALSLCDALVCPTAPTTAPKAGANSSPAEVYLSDAYTVPVNIAGLPGISVNCGRDKAGLPIGLQLIGKAYDDRALLGLAAGFEALGGAK